MSADDLEGGLRRRLVEIDDEVRALLADDFAGKHALRSEADRLRRLLTEVAQADPETLARWAGQAGRKASHSLDEDTERAKARVDPSWESGAG